ncbi:Hypothetical protein PHPALM_9794 [Phytophthora palmivora]|uniref:Chromo domain-containing protein n=1 Tax=Phytophthora palmivora TaxID=4796 RepID=A0A2P4Y6C3_9STRA|nr:Hypothetical protein PHPALM_9794 [Phytophthora palmivora]
MVYAINNSRDSTRQKTPFYLVHGWDARSTMKAMTESVRQGQSSSADLAAPVEWRREANRHREVALRLAAEYQLKEKARRGRFDFDEELLPEDSWEPDEGANQYEVEAILDDELPLSTSTSRNERKFKVKWVGYEEPSWEPLSNLSCGGLLFDYLRQKKRENRLQMVQVADEE